MSHSAQPRVVIRFGRNETAVETNKESYLSNGPNTFEFSTEIFAVNRERLIEVLRQKMFGKPVVVLQGGSELPVYDTDLCYPFRQESFFMWAFGVEKPGCYGVIDVVTKTSHLFIPRFPKAYEIWKGRSIVAADMAKRYSVHHAHYDDELLPIIKSLEPTVLLTLYGKQPGRENSLEVRFPGIDRFIIDHAVLYDAMAALRVRKTDEEIQLMKYVNEISSEAIRNVMRFAQPGKTEYQCEVEFQHFCFSIGGCQHLAFPGVCASSENAAYTNYSHTSSFPKTLESRDTCLLNMGASYFGYCSCIASFFPIGGKFSSKQRFIYEAVLTVSTTIVKLLKPGVNWADMHMLAHRILLTELKKGNLLKGDVEDMVGAGLGTIFHPHGIGHLIGLDVHDVGGFIGVESQEVKIPNLRIARNLENRMIITLSPGCYFNKYLLGHAMESVVLNRFLNMETINKYMFIGGVKIEDDILITKKGAVNLTKLPRTVNDIESWLAGQKMDF